MLDSVRESGLQRELNDISDGNLQNAFAPFTYSLVNQGSLPPGLTLSLDGIISGTPTRKGRYTFMIKSTDSDGMAGVRQYKVAVSAVTAFSMPALSEVRNRKTN